MSELEQKTKQKTQYLVRIFCNTQIQQERLNNIVTTLHTLALKRCRKNITVCTSLGYLELKNNVFGILIEEVNDVDFLEYLHNFILSISHTNLRGVGTLEIKDVKYMKISPNMWEDVGYLTNLKKDS